MRGSSPSDISQKPNKAEMTSWCRRVRRKRWGSEAGCAENFSIKDPAPLGTRSLSLASSSSQWITTNRLFFSFFFPLSHSYTHQGKARRLFYKCSLISFRFHNEHTPPLIANCYVWLDESHSSSVLSLISDSVLVSKWPYDYYKPWSGQLKY